MMKAIGTILAAAAIGALGLAALNAPQQGDGHSVTLKGLGTRAEVMARGHDLAMFAGGCFWCTEADFRRLKGVVDARVGFCGGKTDKVSYKQVCSGTTGHAEVVQLEFDPKVISFQKLVRHFFVIHDSTQVGGQGPDMGDQYRSAIFTYDEAQAKEAKAVRAEVAKKLPKPVTTSIEPVRTFWQAEDYHQRYFEKNGIIH